MTKCFAINQERNAQNQIIYIILLNNFSCLSVRTRTRCQRYVRPPVQSASKADATGRLQHRVYDGSRSCENVESSCCKYTRFYCLYVWIWSLMHMPVLSLAAWILHADLAWDMDPKYNMYLSGGEKEGKGISRPERCKKWKMYVTSWIIFDSGDCSLQHLWYFGIIYKLGI